MPFRYIAILVCFVCLQTGCWLAGNKVNNAYLTDEYSCNDIHFKVQVGAFFDVQTMGIMDSYFEPARKWYNDNNPSSNTASSSAELTTAIPFFVEVVSEELYCYYIGKYNQYDEADKALQSLKQIGYNGAHLVAFDTRDHRIAIDMRDIIAFCHKNKRR